MKLQQLIDQTDLVLNAEQTRAFFLGALAAKKPLIFSKALDELTADDPTARPILEAELKKLWEELGQGPKQELTNLFSQESDIETVRDQLDFFLTALTLAGTTSDDEEILEDLEDLVMKFDDFLSGEEIDEEELKESLLETWADYLETL